MYFLPLPHQQESFLPGFFAGGVLDPAVAAAPMPITGAVEKTTELRPEPELELETLMLGADTPISVFLDFLVVF